VIYVHLFHGRLDPEEILDDWGKDGPTFRVNEKYNSVHVTYATNIKWHTPESDFVHLMYYEDMVFYDGIFYGDWTVTDTAPSRIVEYEEAKAVLPGRLTQCLTE